MNTPSFYVSNNYSGYCEGISLVPFITGDPEAFKRTSDMQQMLQYRRKPGQGGPPKRERGDKYIVIGAIVGMIVGGVVGVTIGTHYIGFILGFFGGIIVGGMIGATIGSFIKNWKAKADKKRQDGENSGSPYLNND